MAYVLGYFYADGGLEHSPQMRGKYVRFSSTDRELLLHVKKMMSAEHPLVKKKVDSSKQNYLLRIGDINLYGDLEKIGLYPNKSLTITMPAIPKEYLCHFIRGYFDGDGCVYIERQHLKRGQYSIKRLCTIYTSGSKIFLEQLAMTIKDATGNQSKILKNGTAFQLRYGTSASVDLFKFMYSSSYEQTRLKRKYFRYKTFFSERKNWIDTEIQSILSRT